MIYISLDIETTGLNPERDQILQIAMVREDTSENPMPRVEDLPTFCCFVKHDRIEGDPYALAMNGWIIEALVTKYPTKHPVYDQEEMLSSALLWLDKFCPDQRLTAAGKNVAGFDMPFLPRDIRRRFRHRVIDVGSVMIDWHRSEVPSLGDLKRMHNMGDVSHDALEDARDVIRLLRKTYPVKQ